MAACATCSKELATADVLYDERGEVICATCTEQAGLARDERKAGRNVKVAGITSAVGAVFGFLALVTGFGLGFYVGAIAAISSGLFALNGLVGSGSARFTKLMSKADITVTWIGLAIGFGLSAYETLGMVGVVTIRLWIR
jgi:hypothetical protein